MTPINSFISTTYRRFWISLKIIIFWTRTYHVKREQSIKNLIYLNILLEHGSNSLSASCNWLHHNRGTNVPFLNSLAWYFFLQFKPKPCAHSRREYVTLPSTIPAYWSGNSYRAGNYERAGPCTTIHIWHVSTNWYTPEPRYNMVTSLQCNHNR